MMIIYINSKVSNNVNPSEFTPFSSDNITTTTTILQLLLFLVNFIHQVDWQQTSN